MKPAKPGKVALRTTLFLFICPVILILSGTFAKTASPLIGALTVGAVTSCFTFLLTLLFLYWDGLSVRDIGLDFTRRSIPKLLGGFVLGLGLVALQNLCVSLWGHTHWVSVRPHQTSGVFLLALAGYFLLALREELAFRGYALRRLESTWNMWTAILVIAVVFTLEHAAGGWTWSRTLLGPPVGALLFGMAALAIRGIAFPLGIHAAFNFGQWAMGQKEITGLWRPMTDAGFAQQAETIGYAAYIAGMLLATSGFWIWHKRHSNLT